MRASLIFCTKCCPKYVQFALLVLQLCMAPTRCQMQVSSDAEASSRELSGRSGASPFSDSCGAGALIMARGFLLPRPLETPISACDALPLSCTADWLA